jgi:hypothetical protein
MKLRLPFQNHNIAILEEHAVCHWLEVAEDGYHWDVDPILQKHQD